MGVITRSFEQESDLTVFTVVGEVNAEQVLAEILAFLKEQPTQLVLWDITAGSLAGIPNVDLRRIVERAKKYTRRRKGGHTAIVCSTVVDYGLSRMFQTFTELLQVPFEISVSRDIKSAREWLAAARSNSDRQP